MLGVVVLRCRMCCTSLFFLRFVPQLVATDITEETFLRQVDTVRDIALFQQPINTLVAFRFLRNLRELVVVQHPKLRRLDGLSGCPLLEQLCISECGLDTMQGLSGCTKLKRLNLSSNM